MSRNVINEIGNRYGQLQVIALGNRIDKKRNTYWLCKCACGNTREYLAYNLRGGHSESCGCLHYKTKSLHRNWKGCGEIYGTYFNGLKNNAKNRNLSFEISIEFLWSLFLKQNRKCALSNLVLILPVSSKDKNATASLDRIDSQKGYLENNVQWVHKDLNVMKMSLPQDVFVNYCRQVVNHLDK